MKKLVLFSFLIFICFISSCTKEEFVSNEMDGNLPLMTKGVAYDTVYYKYNTQRKLYFGPSSPVDGRYENINSEAAQLYGLAKPGRYKFREVQGYSYYYWQDGDVAFLQKDSPNCGCLKQILPVFNTGLPSYDITTRGYSVSSNTNNPEKDMRVVMSTWGGEFIEDPDGNVIQIGVPNLSNKFDFEFYIVRVKK